MITPPALIDGAPSQSGVRGLSARTTPVAGVASFRAASAPRETRFPAVLRGSSAIPGASTGLCQPSAAAHAGPTLRRPSPAVDEGHYPRVAKPARERIAGVAAGASPLLVSPKTGRRLTRQAIYGLVGRLAQAAGVGELSPHGRRATMVTLALDSEMALRDVQDSARHADPRTTRLYDRDRHSLNRHAALRLAELGNR